MASMLTVYEQTKIRCTDAQTALGYVLAGLSYNRKVTISALLRSAENSGEFPGAELAQNYVDLAAPRVGARDLRELERWSHYTRDDRVVVVQAAIGMLRAECDRVERALDAMKPRHG